MKLYAFAAIALLTLVAQTGPERSRCGPESISGRKTCSVVGQKCDSTRNGCCDLYVCSQEADATCQKVVQT